MALKTLIDTHTHARARDEEYLNFVFWPDAHRMDGGCVCRAFSVRHRSTNKAEHVHSPVKAPGKYRFHMHLQASVTIL